LSCGSQVQHPCGVLGALAPHAPSGMPELVKYPDRTKKSWTQQDNMVRNNCFFLTGKKHAQLFFPPHTFEEKTQPFEEKQIQPTTTPRLDCSIRIQCNSQKSFEKRSFEMKTSWALRLAACEHTHLGEAIAAVVH